MEAVRADQPPARAAGDPRRPLRERDHRRSDGLRHRRGSARHVAGEDGRAQDAGRGRPADRRDGQPDLRRGQRGAARVRAGRQGPRPQAAGPHPPHQRPRRRPGVHADRADPGHPLRAGEDGPVDRRHRHRRDQRGVRAGRAGLAQGDQGRPGEGQPQRRRDRARSSARRDRAPSCSPPC